MGKPDQINRANMKPRDMQKMPKPNNPNIGSISPLCLMRILSTHSSCSRSERSILALRSYVLMLIFLWVPWA